MKKIGILGTGMVGQTIGNKLVQLGYFVTMGSRSAQNEKAMAWVETNGSNAKQGTFADAVEYGQIIFICAKGEHTLDVIRAAGIKNFAGKTVIDISNPLDFSKGMPPTLLPQFVNTHSIGEEIQKLLPHSNVVKSLNIVNCEVMVDASRCGGDATMFVAGNDMKAKREVVDILHQFGWEDVLDLGGIQHARSLEMMLPVWLSIYLSTQNGYIAFKIIR